MLGFYPLGGAPLGDDGSATGHSLAAVNLATPAPSLAPSPAIRQRHGFAASAIVANGPTIGAPAVRQRHAVVAVPLATPAPTFGTAPAVRQRHAIVAVSIVGQSPRFDAPPPAARQSQVFVAIGIVAEAPTIGAPSLAELVAPPFVAIPIATPAPRFSAIVFRQAHAISANGISSGVPRIGAPRLAVILPPSSLSPAWEDLDAFFDLDDFAVRATIETDAGATRIVSGIFDDPYMNAQLGEYDMDTSRPRFLAKAVDLAGIRRGDAATIAGKSYNVLTGPKSTGDGMASLDLAEA